MLYVEILEKFDTGDIVLFRDNTFIDKFCDLFVERSYSDGGIIIKTPPNHEEGLYILMTTTYDKSAGKYSVSIKNFKDVYDNIRYKNIYWRRLICTRDNNFYSRLYNLYNVLVHNKSNSTIHWIEDQYNAYRYKGDAHYAWCSICLYTYVCLAVVPIYVDWSLASPDIFTKHGLLDQTLQNVTLNEELQII